MSEAEKEKSKEKIGPNRTKIRHVSIVSQTFRSGIFSLCYLDIFFLLVLLLGS